MMLDLKNFQIQELFTQKSVLCIGAKKNMLKPLHIMKKELK